MSFAHFRFVTLRLTHKVIAIGATGVLGLALVGGLYWSGTRTQASYERTAAEANAIATSTEQLSIQMLEARRAEKDFLLRSDDKYVKAHGDVVKTIAGTFDDIARRLTTLGQTELLRQTAAARADYEQYVKNFATLADSMHKLGLNENDGLQGSLRKAVQAIESTIVELKDVRLEAGMLTMRRHEKDFIMRRDAKYGDAMKKGAADFTRALSESPIPSAQKDGIAQKLALYQRDFFAYISGVQELTQNQKGLSDAYAKFEPQIVGVVKAIERVRDEAVSEREAVATATAMRIQISILAITIFVMLVAFFISRSIGRPLNAMTGAMNELASGKFDVVLPGLGRKDEIGEIAGAVEKFKDNLAEKARAEAEEKAEADRRAVEVKRDAEAREAAQQRAAEEKAAAERKAAMHRLADDFERAVGAIIEGVSSAATELEAAANTLTQTADTTQQLSGVVAAASEQASANVQSVASATEEMTCSVSEISRQVQESSNIAGEAVRQAQKTDARIAELSHAASRIGDVVKLITSVAEQTNLLALNATIEAARAGEAGKGFAVVAQEVKALAAQTAKATDEISSQIAGMQTATQESVTAIKEIGGTIGRISEIAATIAAAVEEQGAATQEISRNVQEAAKGTSQVASNIGSVNRGAGETGSASSQVLSSAQSLASESGHLKIEVQKFLETVRAA